MEGRLVEGDKRANFFLVAVWVEIVWARAETVWAEVEASLARSGSRLGRSSNRFIYA